MSFHQCKTVGCCNVVADSLKDFCVLCTLEKTDAKPLGYQSNTSLSEQYPKYYKSVGELTEVDVYAVHHLFEIQDPSGCIQHASKKLLLSGVRTGGKSKHDDIREARDTLNRWLELNPS